MEMKSVVACAGDTSLTKHPGPIPLGLESPSDFLAVYVCFAAVQISTLMCVAQVSSSFRPCPLKFENGCRDLAVVSTGGGNRRYPEYNP
jgi:hypothetical protein